MSHACRAGASCSGYIHTLDSSVQKLDGTVVPATYSAPRWPQAIALGLSLGHGQQMRESVDLSPCVAEGMVSQYE